MLEVRPEKRPTVEEILELVDRTEQEVMQPGDAVSGDIYIGTGETDGVRQIARAAKELQMRYAGIRFHIASGDAVDVCERLDKGLLDFGLLIQPTDIAKYDYLSLPAKDSWGVILRRDSPLAAKQSIRAEDLVGEPLIFSRQVLEERSESNELAKWFGPSWNDLNIVTTFNLCYNAAVMAKQGVGCVVSLDKLVDTSADSPLCFRSLEPRLESGLDIMWKKYQVFSPAAEVFLDRLRDWCAENLDC